MVPVYTYYKSSSQHVIYYTYRFMILYCKVEQLFIFTVSFYNMYSEVNNTRLGCMDTYKVV